MKRIAKTLCLIALVLGFAAMGCKKSVSPRTVEALVEAPVLPEQLMEDAVRIVLPPFLSLDSIDFALVPDGSKAYKANFTAVVFPREDLYEAKYEVEGIPRVILLRAVQTKGERATLYGSVEVKRAADQWSLGRPQVEIGFQQFGRPRGAFPAQSYLAGSPKANAALKEQEENARLTEANRKAVIEERRQESVVRQKLILGARQKLILATARDTHYVGIIAREDERLRISLVFTEQDGFLIRAKVTSPDRPREKQIFSGELIFSSELKPEPKEDRDVYPIAMSPTGGSNFAATGDHFGWFFRGQEGSLQLRLTGDGLEGETGGRYFGGMKIRLQREKLKPPNPIASRDIQRISSVVRR